jgi:hypothetical protein
MRIRSYIGLFAALLLCGSAFAQVDYHPKIRTEAEMFTEQRRVIGAWCRFDFEGARLGKDGWTRFAPLTTLKSNPEFATFYVISRYQVEKPESASNTINVSYYQLGEFRPEAGFIPGTRVETVRFETTEREGEIVIRDLSLPQPRVSRQAAIAWLKQQVEAAGTDADKFPFVQALKLLAPAASAPESAK